jgi:YaiO family outer membrane protein
VKGLAAAGFLLLLSTAAEAQQSSYDRGVAARLAGDAEAAVAALSEAVAAEPGNADAHLQLGLALLQAGRLDEAEASLRRTLALAPDYEDAHLALARLAERRRAAPEYRTQVDLDGSYSALEGGRPDWKEVSLQFRQRMSESSAIGAGAEYARRFGRSDLYLEGRLEHRFSDAVTAYASLGGTPEADFRPEWQVGAGGTLRLGGRANATILTLDARAAEYPAGRIYTLNPGVEQYLAGGRVWLTGRWINVFGEDGDHVSGWLGRGDLMATDRLRLFAGASDAPDLSEGVVTDLFSLFGGVSYDVTPRTTLRLSLAHEDRERGGDRLQAAAGLGFRF